MKRLLIAMLLTLMLLPTAALCNDDYGTHAHNIYWETVCWQKWDVEHGIDPPMAGNPMGHAQILFDGDKMMIAEGQGGVLLYRDQQINGAAFVQSTPRFDYYFNPDDPGFPGNANYSTKGATMLNGVIYSQDMWLRIHKCTGWEGAWDEPGTETGRVESDSYGLVTDGTYLYCIDNPAPYDSVDPPNRNNCSSMVYKWEINPTTGAISNVPGWPKEIPGPHSWLVSNGYYDGKLYAAEGFRGRNIYEIDCDDGESRTLLNAENLMPEELGVDDWYMGQTARCGNVLAYAGWSGRLITWKLTDGVWTKWTCWNPPKPTGANYLIGLSLKPGPDGNGKYAWTCAANLVGFWDLDPDYTARGLGEARKAKNNYPVGVGNAVITKIGTGEFWVEDVDRAAGCRVAWGGATVPELGKLVTIKGGMGIADNGEKVLNATEVTLGAVADPAIKPVYVSNKNLGPTADSAGLATDGMLVKVSGMLTLVDPYDAEGNPNGKNALYIDDGSAVANDKEGAVTGLKVTTASLIDVPDIMYATPGSTEVTVTGIVRLEKLTDGTVIRKIEALSDTDIVLTTL